MRLFPGERGAPHRLLFLGAHSDDIEIGCGGTLFRLLDEHAVDEVTWVVFSAEGTRGEEARASAGLLLGSVRRGETIFHSYKDGYFPHAWSDIKDSFELLKSRVSPDIIFTHYRGDLHQDHRIVSELTWNTFRDHLILEYEIVKYDGDLGTPNFFVHLSDIQCQKKIDHVRTCFKTQQDRQWFEDATFRSVLRLRGVESNAPEKYAEAFYCRKIVM